MQELPRQFGKYVLLKPLAKGGMGEIYLAAAGEIDGFEKACVIKRVLAEKADRGKANRFIDEAKVVLQLNHANLVSTFDAGEVDGQFYIAMELVEGKDLREIWNRCVRTRTRIPLDVALFVVREVARALAYVHGYGELNLIHRDVAPPNILVSYFGEVKLTDFGLARSVLKREHTSPGVVFGRASYLAPEQARGEVADARTDIYTLGIVLWELLTGQQLFRLNGLDPASALSLVRSPKIVPPSSRAPWLTADIDATVMKALALRRQDRFQTAEELRRALSDVMSTVAPRVDAERVAQFVRELYTEIVTEERAERERLLKVELPRFRSADGRPRTTLPATPPPPPPSPPPSPSGPELLVGDSTDGSGGSLARTAARMRHEVLARQHGVPLRSEPPAPSPSPPPPPPPAAVPPPIPADAARPGDEPTTQWDRPPAQGRDAFIGRTIDGRYRILRKLGFGGMGAVYAAEHVEIGKQVAIKVLHPYYSGQPELVERFRREARAASRVGHPNIIDVVDFGATDDGCAYVVMEQLDGIDLADVLHAEKRMEPARAVQICAQVCRALQAAHQVGILHRDLKPENIYLVARDGEADFVKVLDFGIARSVGGESRRLTDPGMAVGTPEYMAPEQAMGRMIDQRADIYAIGALLYEMVTGAPPHAGGTFMEVLEKKKEPPLPPRELRPELSEELEQVIMRTLDRDPARRPQSMAQLEYELTKSIRGRDQAVAALLGIHATTPTDDAIPRPYPDGQTDIKTVKASLVGISARADSAGSTPTLPSPPPLPPPPPARRSAPRAAVLDDTPPPPPPAPARRSAPRAAIHDDSDDLKVETPPARRSSSRAAVADDTPPPPPARRSAPRPAADDLSGSDMMRLAGVTPPPEPAPVYPALAQPAPAQPAPVYPAPLAYQPPPAYPQAPSYPVAPPSVYDPQVPYAPVPSQAVAATTRDWRTAGAFIIIAIAVLAFILACRWIPWMRGPAASSVKETAEKCERAAVMTPRPLLLTGSSARLVQTTVRS